MKTLYGFFLAVGLLLSACGEPVAPDTTAAAPLTVDTTVSSRGVDVPVTYIVPDTGRNAPLVVLAHGHGGSRHEAGGYDLLAERLAERGIASIRMDFPGCGDSSESFTHNNLTNMLADIRAVRDFALTVSGVDRSRVGIHGYSMGGRLAILTAAADDTYAVIGSWAPEATNGAGNIIEFLGGEEKFAALKAQAAAQGFAPFTTRWGQDQELGLQFFADMERTRPLEEAAKLDIPLLVLYGELDDVVRPEVAEAVIAAAVNSPKVVRHVVKGADHGFGIFSDEPHLLDETVSNTVNFFASEL